jgi:SpoVK/Ycf46/Vps4 family AAA+-type ATPase
MQLQYNERFDYFTVSADFETVDVKLGNKDKFQKFMNGNFDEIFNNFDPDSDAVKPVEFGNEIYFVQSRSLEKASEDYFGKKKEKFDQLPSGIYSFDYKMNVGLIIKPMRNIEFDNYINLSNSNKTIYDDINQFFNKRDVFENYGMEFSRGSLAYGPQGTGKTMTIMNSVSNIIQERDNTVAFVIKGQYPRYFEDLTDFKKILEGNQDFIFIIEEITDQSEDFESILSFLDGENSWSRSYNIATTNYPDTIPANVIDRPGRFDNIYEFNNPNAQDRRKYFSSFDGVEVTDELIDKTEGFSIAHLKEVIIRSELHDQSMIQTVNELHELKQKVENGFSGTETLDPDKAEDITRNH